MRSRTLLFCLVAIAAGGRSAQGLDHDRGIILAGEPVRRNGDSAIRFSDRQIRETSAATREGLVRWIATPRGQELFRRFTKPEYRVVVIEDPDEPAIGRAPEPGIVTLLAAGDPAKLKVYTLILNPTRWTVPEGATPLPNEPAVPGDFMAAAWAAEMLHIYLYSQGIRLPHHQRDDFQESWLAVANELGFPGMTHGDYTDDSSGDVNDWRRSGRRWRGRARDD